MNTEHLVPGLDKALSLLEHLGRNPGGGTQAELAATLAISPSTCYRILRTLQKHDFVSKRKGGRFDLSGGLLVAAMRLVDGVKRFERVQPVLDALAAKTGLSCKISIRQGFEQLSILRAESPLAVSVTGKVGARFPLIEGSVGAALLCAESAAVVHELVTACAEQIEERRHPRIVLERIASITAKGFALNARENRWHVEAMSVPVRGEDGTVLAAVTLIGFKNEFGDIKRLSAALRAAAAAMAAQL
jgi:DNA-binding IclR family transcriptional regulator